MNHRLSVILLVVAVAACAPESPHAPSPNPQDPDTRHAERGLTLREYLPAPHPLRNTFSGQLSAPAKGERR